MSTRRTLLLTALLLGGPACTAATDSGLDPSDGIIVPEGKEDDFLSATAQEFVLTGRTSITLESSLRDATESEREARVHELVSLKQIAVSWFLTQYFIEKEHDATNPSYGGFGGMAKANGWDELDIRREDDLTYSFALHQLVAGPRDLLSRLPTTPGDDGARVLTITIGRPTNEEMAKLETNHEWYRSAPWDSFDPTRLAPEQLEELTLAIAPEVESADAWFDYDALFADDALTIDVHFGWDYHSAYHVSHSRALFAWLVDHGFEPPVATFEQLGRTSGAFERTLRANGRDVEVAVRIFYGKDDSDTDPDTDAGGRVLEDDMRASLRESDVIVYSGHSGPFYGFALGNWRSTSEGDLDDSEMASVEMPRERYQVVFAEGCDTYHIGEAFRRNPAKPDGRYIDIITTTAPSDAGIPSAVQDLVATLIETDSRGAHRPRTLMSLVRDLDSNSAWAHTMYGIHGIDDNPQVHPYAASELMCGECQADADCGGVGNRCVRTGSTARFCAPACTTDSGCGEGYGCSPVASSSSRTIYDRVCVPRDGSC
jgi:hypothetical protein